MAKNSLITEEIETEVLEIVRRMDEYGNSEDTNPRYVGIQGSNDPLDSMIIGERGRVPGQIDRAGTPSGAQGLSQKKENPDIDLGSGDGKGQIQSTERAFPTDAVKKRMSVGVIHIDRDLDTKVSLMKEGAKVTRREFREKVTMYPNGVGAKSSAGADPCATFERIQVENDVTVNGKVVDSQIDYKETSDGSKPMSTHPIEEEPHQGVDDTPAGMGSGTKDFQRDTTDIPEKEIEERLGDLTTVPNEELEFPKMRRGEIPPSAEQQISLSHSVNEHLTLEITEMVLEYDPSQNSVMSSCQPNTALPGKGPRETTVPDVVQQIVKDDGSFPTKSSMEQIMLQAANPEVPDSHPGMSLPIVAIQIPQRKGQSIKEEFNLKTTEIYFVEKDEDLEK